MQSNKTASAFKKNDYLDALRRSRAFPKWAAGGQPDYDSEMSLEREKDPKETEINDFFTGHSTP
jgi:hypothetical protein